MRYLAIAFDYDGTLATDGRVTADVIEKLKELIASRKQLILVTGRQLANLIEVFPEVNLFQRIVCENGATLYCPESREERSLAEPPPLNFVKELEKRKVTPLSVGRSIVATWRPNESIVIDTIRDLGLEMQVIFNKGAVMILPSGINKGTGLKTALEELKLSEHNLIGIGDAENDHSFLAICKMSVAVSNALPAIKNEVDLVTRGDHGTGVIELIDHVLKNDLSDLEVKRNRLVLGLDQDEAEVTCDSYGTNILIAGPSGSGKSKATLAFLEQLANRGYQFCIIDPEGDYQAFDRTVVLGDTEHAPNVDEVLQLLKEPAENAIVNLLGLPLHERPDFFAALLPHLQHMRVSKGRPHWIIIDEAHHLLPSEWKHIPQLLPSELGSLLFITVHPDKISPGILDMIDVLIAIGDQPQETIKEFAEHTNKSTDKMRVQNLDKNQALVWFKPWQKLPMIVHLSRSETDRRRHRRKYAEGELSPEQSFYFTGPDGKLNLRAHNLFIFNQLAEGVDDKTWLHHLKNHDYSKWFKEGIKDEELSQAAAEVENNKRLSSKESRQHIKSAIEERYTVPA